MYVHIAVSYIIERTPETSRPAFVTSTRTIGKIKRKCGSTDTHTHTHEQTAQVRRCRCGAAGADAEAVERGPPPATKWGKNQPPRSTKLSEEDPCLVGSRRGSDAADGRHGRQERAVPCVDGRRGQPEMANGSKGGGGVRVLSVLVILFY